MLIFILLYTSAMALVSTILSGIFKSSEAIIAVGCLIAIACFLGGALLHLLPRQTSRIFGIGIIAIVVIVAIEQLAPYQASMEKIIAAIIAIILTCIIKRRIFRFLRTNRAVHLPRWAHVVLSVV